MEVSLCLPADRNLFRLGMYATGGLSIGILLVMLGVSLSLYFVEIMYMSFNT